MIIINLILLCFGTTYCNLEERKTCYKIISEIYFKKKTVNFYYHKCFIHLTMIICKANSIIKNMNYAYKTKNYYN